MSKFFVFLVLAQLGGFIRFEEFARVDQKREIHKSALTFQLNGGIERKNSRFFFVSDFIGDLKDKKFYVRPIEAYLALRRGKFDFFIGKKIHTWGTGVGLNPTDFVTPWDFRELYTELEEFREGIASLEADLYLGDFALKGIYIPLFSPTRLPLKSWQVALSESGTLFLFDPSQEKLPDFALENGEGVFRILKSLGSFDFSFTAFSGFDRDPNLFVSPIDEEAFPDTILITYRYPPIKMFGFDFSTVFKEYEIHGEAAYFHTRDPEGKDPLTKNPYFFGIFGTERSLFDSRMTLSFEIAVKYIENFVSSRSPFWVPFARQILYETNEAFYYGVLHFSYANPEATLNFNGLLIFDLTEEDYFTNPVIQFHPSDRTSLSLGMILGGGRGGSPFSLMGKHLGRTFFADLRYYL